MDSNLVKKIAIIGAGQLGSRHLQALALLSNKALIYVIDPDESSLEISKNRFESINGHEKHETNYFSSLKEIPDDHIDIVIVATNAAIRSKVVFELLENKKVKFLILEKFLFQSEKEFQEVGALIDNKNVKAFVNCPRRIFKSYQLIKEMLADEAKEYFQLDIVGNNWGLGCNGIHFIDLYHFFTGKVITDWDNILDDGFLTSKRKGYVDFSGRLSSSDKHQSLRLTSLNHGAPNVSIRITTLSTRILINEGAGKVFVERLKDGVWALEEIAFEMEYQSGLSKIVAEDLFFTGTCGLTQYEDSCKMHLPFLRTLLSHYNDIIKEKTDICPIT